MYDEKNDDEDDEKVVRKISRQRVQVDNEEVRYEILKVKKTRTKKNEMKMK